MARATEVNDTMAAMEGRVTVGVVAFRVGDKERTSNLDSRRAVCTGFISLSRGHSARKAEIPYERGQVRVTCLVPQQIVV